MKQHGGDRKQLARKFLRKVSGIASLLRSPSKRRSDDFLPGEVAVTGSLDGAKTPEPDKDRLNPLSNVQLSGQDSLEVASSEWSQTKSGKRKQKRRGNEKQPNALDTQSAASSPAQRDAAFQRASSPQDRHSDTHFDASVAAAALGSAGADGRLGNAVSPKQLGISLMPRAASPLGKEGLAGLRGHAAPQANQQSDSPGGSLGLLQEAIEAQQHEVAALQPSARLLATQDDADVLVLTRSAVSRAHQVNADLCQVERSQRSGSPVLKSPRKAQLDLGLVSRASSDSRLVTHSSSATSLVRLDSAELPQLTEPEMIHKVVKKIKAMYGSCSTGESCDVIHMLGSIQASLKAYAASESLWLADQPSRVRHAYLCKCFPGTDAKVVHSALQLSKGSVDQAALVLERKGLNQVPSAFCLKDVFQSVQKMSGVEWVVVWDTCSLMRDQWVGYQLLEESRVYQVIPFMTHLELNHIKDDKLDAERAHKGQEAVKLVHAGLQPQYKGCFKLQPEYGEPTNARDYLPSLTADRDKHIGDDLILQCAAFWDHKAQERAKRMVFFTNDIALSNRAIALGMETNQATHWLKHCFL
ncbi:hypothetical protein ABBQ38_006748 [Trebouxia sp. C0009 RCD-2024]